MKPSSLSESSLSSWLVSYYIYQQYKYMPADSPQHYQHHHWHLQTIYSYKGKCIILSLAFDLIEMGQNICQQVNIEKNFCCFDTHREINILDDVERDVQKQEGEQTARKQNPNPGQTGKEEKERGEVSNFQSEEGVREDDIFINTGILDRLNELRSIFQEVNTPKELYLTIDKAWQQEIKVQGEDIRHFYTKLKENKYERTGSDNRKCQILFRQHIPIIGKFYFEVEIQASNPQKDSDFIIGVLDYLQGVKKVHSKGSKCEESFIFKAEKSVNPEERLKRSRTVLKVEIDRENNRLAYYVNNELKKQNTESKLLKESNESTEMMSLVPYIQTQSVGFVFSWRIMPMQRSSDYKMSTIIEEESSIRATS